MGSLSMHYDTNRPLVQVSLLARYVYCRRLGYMEWVQNEFESNADVVEGEYHHRNVDVPRGANAAGDGETIHATSVAMSDHGLGLTTKMDLLEVHGRRAVPVEYKKGRVPDTPERARENYMVQLCAQGLLLRANGYECDTGVIYYVASKTRVEVPLDDALVAKTLQYLHDMRRDGLSGNMPPPLVDSPKCPRCSLVGICMPDETNALSGGAAGGGPDGIRRMYPVRTDAVPVYIHEQGARVTLSGDCLVIKTPDGKSKRIRLIDVAGINIMGNVQVTTQALRKLCGLAIPVCYHSYAGRFEGMVVGGMHKNVELRMHQYRAHADRGASMAIARQIVYGKIRNSITMLRRNHVSPPAGTLSDMRELARRALEEKRYEALLGLEGMAAREYFSQFSGMLKSDVAEFAFTERNRRPPRDTINAILSFLYTRLTSQAAVTASRVGFDPYLGFLHMPKYGKPALALDLMEEFRPIVADSACITIINNGTIDKSDVVVTKFGANLTKEGRTKVIRAYEQRMDSTVQHGVLGYSASYKRIMETQARLLARHLSGEIPAYPPFRTR